MLSFRKIEKDFFCDFEGQLKCQGAPKPIIFDSGVTKLFTLNQVNSTNCLCTLDSLIWNYVQMPNIENQTVCKTAAYRKAIEIGLFKSSAT